MNAAVLAPGARIQCRDAEWLVRTVGRSSDGQTVVDVVGVSPFLREQPARFLLNLEQDLKVLAPEDTELVPDLSPRYRDSLLFLEAHLRRTIPTDGALVVGHQAAMDVMDYQLVPAAKALAMPRQRLLIADAVGLGKTLECGILISELIRRGRGKRILVVTTKSMLVQFQKEFWTRFSIPLVRLDSVGIQRIRQHIPTNQNPFHYYDRAIVSVDTLKQDREYRAYLDSAEWDIIVIDECQNVAERGNGAQKSQRARLANRLATRSDTLILLSATPHDGKPESFASLMNMLDPTAIANPSEYGPEDIRDLYVRRFRKDVLADLRRHVPERDAANIETDASPEEEQVFSALADLTLPDTDRKAKAGQLFRTTLQKAMLSSPMACLETVRNRLRRLENAPEDEASLEALVPLLEAIGPEQFSKYQRLLSLIRKDWQWQGRDPRDRLVLFTGRRETQRFLVEQLRQDLGLPATAVEQLDGSMPDVDQTRLVERFAQEKDPVRILVATEVASEGLNLHYLSHRLVHFDIPWSLMTLQQRNGRIDRYGQTQQPLVRYLLTASRAEGMGDTERILQVLIRKDQQAHENIGDPSVFTQTYDVESEEAMTAEAIEGRDADFEARLDANAAAVLKEGGGLLAELFDLIGSDPDADGHAAEAQATVERRTSDSLYPDLWTYVTTALDAVAEQMERRQEKLVLNRYEDQQRLELAPPADLWRRYERFPRELRPSRDQLLALSTQSDALQAALEQARRRDDARPELEYLWDLHPLVDWLADRGMVTFARHQAPVLHLADGLAPDERVLVFQGTIPNRRGMPVVQEWVAVHFKGSGLQVQRTRPFREVAEELQLGRRDYANPGREIPESLRQQRAQAVQAARSYLLECCQRWQAQMAPELEAQRQRLKRLRGRQQEQLLLDFAQDGRAMAVKEKARFEGQKRIEKRFADHERFVEDVMTIEPAPYLKLVAALIRC